MTQMGSLCRNRLTNLKHHVTEHVISTGCSSHGAGNALRGGNEARRLGAHTGASLRLAVQSGTGEGIWRKG